MSKPSPTVVITGASTGIGHACATYLARKGWHVFAGIRKQADADRLTEELGASVTPLVMDVTDAAGMTAAAEQVAEALGEKTLGGLVNNAGIAVSGPMTDIPIDEFEWQMAVNVTGVVRTTQLFAPFLGRDRNRIGKPGRIVMMSSMAGEMGAPFLGPYSASKHAVEGLTKSLRRELMLFGIQVVVLGPGAVATPIWAKAEEVDPSAYEHTPYYKPLMAIRDYMTRNGPAGLAPDVIAKRVHKSLTQSRPRFRYALVPQRFSNWTLPKLLPARMVDNIVAKRIGLRPEDLDTPE